MGKATQAYRGNSRVLRGAGLICTVPNAHVTVYLFTVRRPGADGSGCWSLIIGSGVKDNGGTVLVYKSKELLDGACRADVGIGDALDQLPRMTGVKA
mgnify:CR=1 FL=1